MELRSKTKSFVKKASLTLDKHGLFLPSRMSTSVSQELLQKGLQLQEEESNIEGGTTDENQIHDANEEMATDATNTAKVKEHDESEEEKEIKPSKDNQDSPNSKYDEDDADEYEYEYDDEGDQYDYEDDED